MRYQDEISTYCGHFTEQLNLIGSLGSHLYRKILLVSILDTLSRARHPNLVTSNHDRFVDFIQSSTGWEDCERVSAPLLLARLEKDPALQDIKLARDLRKWIGQWREGSMPRAADDPRVTELTPSGVLSQNGVPLERHYTHVELFYAYRNVLVHEFREPGVDFGILGDRSPYYIRVDDLDSAEQRWHLVYPADFFQTVGERALENVKQYLVANQLNPYTFYDFDPNWQRR